MLHVLCRTTHQNFSPNSSQFITPCLVTAPMAEISKFHLPRASGAWAAQDKSRPVFLFSLEPLFRHLVAKQNWGRGSGGVRSAGVSQSVRETGRDESQSVASPEKFFKTRDLEFPIFEGSVPRCSPHSTGYTCTSVHPYFPVANKTYVQRNLFPCAHKKHQWGQNYSAGVGAWFPARFQAVNQTRKRHISS